MNGRISAAWTTIVLLPTWRLNFFQPLLLRFLASSIQVSNTVSVSLLKRVAGKVSIKGESLYLTIRGKWEFCEGWGIRWCIPTVMWNTLYFCAVPPEWHRKQFSVTDSILSTRLYLELMFLWCTVVVSLKNCGGFVFFVLVKTTYTLQQAPLFGNISHCEIAVIAVIAIP